MLHTIQIDDVILLPAVGWVAVTTLVVMFPKNIFSELCLILGGTKMWLIRFHILVLTCCTA